MSSQREHGKQDIGAVVWSADSKHVYFDSGLSNDLAIFRAGIADRKVERIADLNQFRRLVDPGS